MPSPRIAFIGACAYELHVPSEPDWAVVRFFPADTGWDAAVHAAIAWKPTHAFVIDPARLDAVLLGALPGIKIALIPSPMAGAPLKALGRQCKPQLAHGFQWVTYPENPLPIAGKDLPLLQTLPLPVDMRRFSRGSLASVRSVLVPAWAQPSKGVMEQLRRLAQVELLPDAADCAELRAALERAGVVLYSSPDLLGRFDPLPLLALASGCLVISATPFPADWNLEPEDELLVREEHVMAATLEDVLQTPEIYKAVRIRGWQKMKECFDASPTLKRLIHDAQLFSDLPGHLEQLAQVGALQEQRPERTENTRRSSRKRAM